MRFVLQFIDLHQQLRSSQIRLKGEEGGGRGQGGKGRLEGRNKSKALGNEGGFQKTDWKKWNEGNDVVDVEEEEEVAEAEQEQEQQEQQHEEQEERGGGKATSKKPVFSFFIIFIFIFSDFLNIDGIFFFLRSTIYLRFIV